VIFDIRPASRATPSGFSAAALESDAMNWQISLRFEAL
jgi:hypothetical protein